MFPATIDDQPAQYLDQVGTVFARFDTQDSGNLSYGVEIAGQRYFVKTAGDPADPKPISGFERRERVLRNAAALAESISHPLLPEYHGLIESAGSRHHQISQLRLVPRLLARRCSHH
ncbi:hypothetical protein [Kribbella sp. CA-293567]|uniref:hypothetical protein n=1 Tax=Kribbella sp. CA-293567 TaxID=3002436 RepID=UPI0022DD875F|nr:hypothetical protein [Kribbella sp. CA-293567]WBQ02404.1 hypothetical protein OX958_20710 [Kribbella sp. CA-293567]